MRGRRVRLSPSDVRGQEILNCTGQFAERYELARALSRRHLVIGTGELPCVETQNPLQQTVAT